MNEETKFGFQIVGIVLLITFGIVAIVGGIMLISNHLDNQALTRAVSCKEVGGIYTYENGSYICK